MLNAITDSESGSDAERWSSKFDISMVVALGIWVGVKRRRNNGCQREDADGVRYEVEAPGTVTACRMKSLWTVEQEVTDRGLYVEDAVAR
tara:strand:- start:1958 stop:2227 length:270 start_codon:yes stop_codon:yes gene_type:complete